jgi:hypothetical protein
MQFEIRQFGILIKPNTPTLQHSSTPILQISAVLYFLLAESINFESFADGKMTLPEPIMFFYILADFPGAGHAGRECDQIPFTDFHRFLPLGRDDNITFQKITGFGFIIGPRKF